MPWHFVYTLALLWLAGGGLRFTVLAIPPVLPQLQAALHLTQGGVGIVSSLPLLVFAVAAIPGAGLIARFGILPTLIGGLLLTALAGAARAASWDPWTLFATTLVMSVGVACMQPSLPPLVNAWTPRHIGLATAVYSNGMLGAEALSTAVTIPVILPLLHSSWRWTLAAWSLPLLLAALLLAARARRHPSATTPTATRSPHRRWLPDLRDARLWGAGLVMGCASAVYFAANAFLPGYLTRNGDAKLIAGALAALNGSQIPATLILLACAQRLATRRWPYIVSGLALVVGIVGLVTASGAWIVAWAGLIGFSAAGMIVLGLTLPALLVAADEVHRFAGGLFTIAYACAFLAPILGGFAWDATGVPRMAFAPALLCAVVVALAGALFRFRRRVGGDRA